MAVKWSIQLCEVLEYLHTKENPIVHCDVKPMNVWVRPDGNVMLTGFEFAAKIGEQNNMGTHSYAAPEQYREFSVSPRTDIYALGLTMYYLVTGKDSAMPPYEEVSPIRQIDPSLSKKLEKIILKCTQREQWQRYHSCVELKKELMKVRTEKNKFSWKYLFGKSE